MHTHVACDVPPHTGPLPPLQRRRRKQTGSAGADGEVEEDDDVDPKKKYNVAMALILMLMVLGLLAVIFAQVRAPHTSPTLQALHADTANMRHSGARAGAVAGQAAQTMRAVD